MDVLDCLLRHMDEIVDDMHGRGELSAATEAIMRGDLDINFDARFFYFTREPDAPKFELHAVHPDVRRMVIGLVETCRMTQNIKNAAYSIHFRNFVDRVQLEDEANTLRVALLASAARHLGWGAAKLQAHLSAEAQIRMVKDPVNDEEAQTQAFRAQHVVRMLREYTARAQTAPPTGDQK